MDELFTELLGVDSDKALLFFKEELDETVEALKLHKTRDDEVWYVASVLAHFAQTSRVDRGAWPAMANLGEVFDNFIVQTSVPFDSEILETGGSQILLFAGFFRKQMLPRHNVAWYDELGRSMYERAAERTTNPKKKRLFESFSESFPTWTSTCSILSTNLHDNRLIVRAR